MMLIKDWLNIEDCFLKYGITDLILFSFVKIKVNIEIYLNNLILKKFHRKKWKQFALILKLYTENHKNLRILEKLCIKLTKK
jgi:hypothetical protein